MQLGLFRPSGQGDAIPHPGSTGASPAKHRHNELQGLTQGLRVHLRRPGFEQRDVVCQDFSFTDQESICQAATLVCDHSLEWAMDEHVLEMCHVRYPPARQHALHADLRIVAEHGGAILP
jgi:hypothetical protein